jgi:hypothetical protein
MYIKLQNGYIYNVVDDKINEGNILEQDEIYRFYRFSDEISKFVKTKQIEYFKTIDQLGYDEVKKNTFIREDEPGFLRYEGVKTQDSDRESISFIGVLEAENTFREWVPKSNGEKRFKRTIRDLENKYS